MAIANFEQLCLGLCEIAGLAAPDLTPDAQGCAAIEVQLDGVTVTIMHGPQTADSHALVLARLGELPEGRELEAARCLLEINCKVQGLGFSFGRNPNTGEIVLQQRYGFDRACAADLYQRIRDIAEGVAGWRQHFFLVETQGEAA